MTESTGAASGKAGQTSPKTPRTPEELLSSTDGLSGVWLRDKIVRATVALLALTGIASLLVVGLLEIELSNRDNDMLEARIRETLLARGESLVKSHADVFRSLVRDTALTEMQSTIADAVEQQDVVYGSFIDHEGRCLAYCSPTSPCKPSRLHEIMVVDSADVLRDLNLGTSAQPSSLQTRELRVFELPVIEFASPVMLDKEHVGVLRYGISTLPLLQTLEQTRERRSSGLRSALLAIVLVVGLCLLTGVLFARRLAFRITEPLKHLKAASMRLAAGDRAVRVQISSGDELELLGNSFNRMTSELEASYSTLESINQDLRKEIEERKLAQKQRTELQDHLIQSQKMDAFGQLAGGVAHDFNNILAVVAGSAELVTFAIEDQSFEEIAQLNQQIAEASAQGANLTRQLLTFARKEVDNPCVVNINQTLTGFERLIRRVLQESVKVVVTTSSPIPHVLIDPGRLEQVLMNLCVNARDAMNGVGTLELKTDVVELDEDTTFTSGVASAGTYVTVAATDTGIGIPKDNLQRVFEPFFTTKPAGQGTGLGLATVHGIVRDAGGQIEVQSIPDKGTCFRIYLPARGGHQEEARTVSLARTPDGEGQAVLLCEDAAAVRMMMERLLERAGYEVTSVASPGDALRRVRECKFDLLITDVIMPEMDGGKLSQAACELQPRLLVLFVSGYTGGVLESCGVKEDSRLFLRKPFKPGEFLHRVHELLRAREPLRSLGPTP